MYKISAELKNKMKKDIEIKKNFYPDGMYGLIKFGLDELKLFYECKKWYDEIERYFKTSYEKKPVKQNFGKFKGVYPYDIYLSRHEVVLSINDIQPSWRDWFVYEE